MRAIWYRDVKRKSNLWLMAPHQFGYILSIPHNFYLCSLFEDSMLPKFENHGSENSNESVLLNIRLSWVAKGTQAAKGPSHMSLTMPKRCQCPIVKTLENQCLDSFVVMPLAMDLFKPHGRHKNWEIIKHIIPENLNLICLQKIQTKYDTVVSGFSALCPSPRKCALNPGSALNPGKFIT